LERHGQLVARIASLTRATRVLLLLDIADSLAVVAAKLPAGEDAAELCAAITPWVDEARRSRRARLRRGPQGAPAVEQRSCIVAPLLDGRALLGALYVDVDGASGRLDATHRDLVATLAEQAAVAHAARLAAARQAKETEQRKAELAVISSIQQGIAGSLSFRAIVELVGDKLREVLRIDTIGIRWYDHATRTAHFLYEIEHGTRVTMAPVTASEARWREVTSDRSVIVRNTAAEVAAAGVAPGTECSLSTVTAKIIVGDRVVGVVVVESFEREYAFGPDEIRLLQTIVGEMGVALENARLFDETQRLLKETEQHNAELAVINSVQSALAAELSIDGIYDAVGDKIREIFHGLDVGIRIYDPATRTVSFPYTLERGRRVTVETLRLTDESRGFGPHVFRTGETLLINRDVPGAMERYGSFVMPGTQATEKSMLLVPMVGGGVVRGLIALADFEREDGFDESDVRLLQTLAASMAVALENARLFDETQRLLKETERGEREASALSEVGRDLSSSLDVSVVMDRIAHHAKDLLQATDSAIFLPDAAAGAYRAMVAVGDDAEAIKATAVEPGVGIIGTLLQSGETELINDIDADPRAVQVPGTPRGSDERLMVVPLRAGAQVLGAMAVWRIGGRRFEPRELEFLVGLSRQATVALRNATLFNETRDALGQVEQQARELTESLDYQTAISDVLRVISQSPTDVAPVFEAILDCATRLFGSAVAAIYRYDGRVVSLVATRNWPAKALAMAQALYPAPADRAQLAGRAILTATVQSLDDALTDPSYNHAFAAAGSWRRVMGAPMLKDGVAVGAILVGWPEPGHTSTRQIELIRTFADQAVIAIENVRLLNETQEALQQQKASAEVLAVISSSVADTKPVFAKILDSCKHLFGGDELDVLLVDGQGRLQVAAYVGDAREAVMATFPAQVEGSAPGRAITERRVVHYADVVNDPGTPPVLRRMGKVAGYHSVAFAPMLWEGRGIGVVGVARSRGPFSEKELSLLQTFADQAVIAIQNARLFNETKEALEQQTATAKILQVISQSPTDVQPVFDAIAERALALCGARIGGVARYDGELVHMVAFHGASPEATAMMRAAFPMPAGPGSVMARAVFERQPVQIPDVMADPTTN
jgi:GAF domain-containing protein